MLAGTAAAWLLAELILAVLRPDELVSKRVLRPPNEPGVSYLCYSSNPHGEFMPVPQVGPGWTLFDSTLLPRPLPLEELSRTPFCVEMRLSSQGLRDREFSSQPAEGTLRIAMVGDSFVYGEGVPIEKTLPRQLEQRLGEGFEVVNAGLPGMALADEVVQLRAVAGRLHCPCALLVLIPNDIGMSPELEARQRYIYDLINIRDAYLEEHERSVWYHGRSRLLRLIGRPFELRRIERETIRWYRDLFDEAKNGPNLERFANDLKRAAATPNCRVAVVIYPLMLGFPGDYPLAEIHHKIVRMSREASLPVLDLLPVFEDQTASRLHVHPTDRHPNGTAHALAAEAIAEWLLTDMREWLKPPSAPNSPNATDP